jgi:hypothetical protein
VSGILPYPDVIRNKLAIRTGALFEGLIRLLFKFVEWER